MQREEARAHDPGVCGWLTAAFLLLCAGVAAPVTAAEIWDADDGTITFTKADFADPALPANQDQITPNVVITRDNSQGIYNAAVEASYSSFASPADTAWAFSGLNGNPAFVFGEGASSFASLAFASWQSSTIGAGPPNTVNVPGVIHLITDDIYLDVLFTSWTDGRGDGGGGGFAYTRAVPEPASVVLLGGALLMTVRRRRAAEPGRHG